MAVPRIAVVGTGANGAAIAADLIRGGVHDVTLIDQWPENVAALRRDGVIVRVRGHETQTPVTAINLCDVATLRGSFDIVLLLVKAYDTAWACELIKPLLAPDGVVAGVQNGMTIDAIARVVGLHRTVGCVIEVGGSMFTPGVVERDTPGDLSWFAVGGFGEHARKNERAVADLLGLAGTVELSPHIRSSKWMKLIVNAAELVPSAILGLPLAEAVRVEGMRRFMIEAGAEAARLTEPLGLKTVPIFGVDVDATAPLRFIETLLDKVVFEYALPNSRTTVLQDWMKGRRSEVHEINGLVVEKAAESALAAPANQRTVAVASQIEAGELDAQPSNVRLLLGD
ncbi:MAG: hypothetical protein JWQ64_1770 [Subtercola sp.]|nr:hypothetical protein [Subtercola sp.]